MNSWVVGIQSALEYIENNLTEKLKIEDIADKAYISPFHFQRIFNVLCGFTVSEYIRNRRLTLAAQELSCTEQRVIDIALKYGYDSHDSFTRAFTRFHGISPSVARQRGADLKSFAPLKIKLTLEGGTMLDYRIEEKLSFTVVGKMKKFNTDTAYEEIPKFWDEYSQNGGHDIAPGMYGLCWDSDGKDFEYYIGCNYLPFMGIPEGYTYKIIPAGTWAIFPCKGKMPESIQTVNTQIWSEWLPNLKGYKLAGNHSLEVYLTPPQPNPDEDYSEIWVPIEAIN